MFGLSVASCAVPAPSSISSFFYCFWLISPHHSVAVVAALPSFLSLLGGLAQ